MNEVPIVDDADGFKLGLGTGNLRDEQRCRSAVESAMEAGYRHIDTARHYGNERAIREGIDQSSVSRSDVFIATKVHSKNLLPEDLRESVHQSLASLEVNTIDLVYVHWPTHSYDPDKTLATLSDLRAEGVIRNIGLCNITPDLLREAQNNSSAPIFGVQVEMHPFLQQRELHEYAQKHDFWLIAHTPLCQGAVLENDTLSDIAEKYAINEAQLTLAWLLEKEQVAAIPGGTNHLNENRRALSVDLATSDIKDIEEISEHQRCIDYEFAPWS